MILTKRQLIKFLEDNNASTSYINWAKHQRRARDIIERCPKAGYLIWLIWAIGGPMLTEYDEKTVLFLIEYDEKITTIWNKFDSGRSTIAKKICTFERVCKGINQQQTEDN